MLSGYLFPKGEPDGRVYLKGEVEVLSWRRANWQTEIFDVFHRDEPIRRPLASRKRSWIF